MLNSKKPLSLLDNGIVYRIFTPIIAIMSGIFGYSIALVQDSSNSEEYVLFSGLGSFLMIFIFSFLGHFKQNINNEKIQKVFNISIFYSICCLILSVITAVLSFIFNHNYYFSLILFGIAFQAGFFLRSFDFQINRNDIFWKYQLSSTTFRLFFLVSFYFIDVVTFYILITANILSSLLLFFFYYKNHFNLVKSFSIPNLQLKLKNNIDGFLRNFRSELEYQYLILIGVSGNYLGDTNNFIKLIPYINAFRIAIRSILNKIDTKVLSVRLSSYIVILGIVIYYIFDLFAINVYEIIEKQFSLNISGIHGYLILIFSLSIWSNGMLGIELKSIKLIYKFYMYVMLFTVTSLILVLFNTNYHLAIIIFYIGIGFSLRLISIWKK